MVKYDGFDCVYGIELFKDERVSNLQVLSEKVGEKLLFICSCYFDQLDSELKCPVIKAVWIFRLYVVFFLIFILCACVSTVNNKIKIPPGAEELVGKAVEHLFEKEDGEKNEWRGMVLSRAPIMTNWYYITYEKDPVLYMYQLWDDYADGDLRILPEAGTGKLCITQTDWYFTNFYFFIILSWGFRDEIKCNHYVIYLSILEHSLIVFGMITMWVHQQLCRSWKSGFFTSLLKETQKQIGKIMYFNLRTSCIPG